ncbi:MAG: FtsX-like permease family protein, partial [Blastocatellia bacterium]
SGLLIRSFHSLRSVDPGFDPENVASVNIGLPENEDKGSQSRVLFYDKIFQHLGSLQGVGSTALTTRLPFGGGGSFEWDGAVPEGRPMVRAESIGSDYRRVSPGYFRTMRIHLTRGREFNEFDGKTGAKVVIISETMARRCWPDQEAVGKHLFFFDSGKLVPHEVVGVAGDAKFGGLDALNDQASYVPIPQDPTPWVYVVTRSSQSAATIAGSIGSMIGLIDKELNVDTVTTMDDLRDEALATPRFNLMLISIFAGLALTLAAIGTYSVISCSASERTQEIGIRMALGASRTEVICLVAGQTAKLALIGVAIGVAAAFALTRLMQSLLFHVSPRDWATYTAVSIFLLAITLAASFIPARRASTVDPLRALRYE